AFPTSTRPDAPAALGTSQSVRVLLDDTLGGQLINLSVDGLDGKGDVVARGTTPVTARRGQEVTVQVELSVGGAGGGSASGGGSATGGSGPQGGGTGSTGGGPAMCQCEGGCCAQGQSACERGNGFFFTCGKDSTCAPDGGTCGTSNVCSSDVCSLLTANLCGPMGCQCGGRASCTDGQRCVGGACVCDGKTCAG